MKLVLDTNVLLVSVTRKSKYFPIFSAFLEGKVHLYYSHDILLEYEEILSRRYPISQINGIFQAFKSSPFAHEARVAYQWNLIAADPEDNKFVDCAITSGATYLVTNDRHFNVLKSVPFPKVDLITADELLNQL